MIFAIFMDINSLVLADFQEFCRVLDISGYVLSFGAFFEISKGFRSVSDILGYF